MDKKQDKFIIKDIYWERIFLIIRIHAPGQQEASFYLKSQKWGSVLVKEKTLSSSEYNNEYTLRINIADARNRSFLDNGRWELFARCEDGKEARCFIDSKVAYRFDDLSRIFPYAENQMAYNVSFGVEAGSGEELYSYIDSYFMIENKRWAKRRYVKEVRKLRDKIKRFFMFAAIVLIRVYYSVLYTIIPKSGKNILIMSETKGVLWGNLKYIDDRLRQRGLDKHFNISHSYRKVTERSQGIRDIFSWFKLVTKIARQDIILIDDYAPVFGFFNLGKKTKLIQVWHAGEGFKSVGYSRFGKAGSPFPQGSCHRKYTHVITGSEHLIDVFNEVFAIGREDFYPLGMARLDGFLAEDNIEQFKHEFYTNNPDLLGKKLILFAPTYRGDEHKLAYYDYDKIDLGRIYEFCQKNNYVFLVKMHPFIKEKLSIPEKYSEAIRDFSDFANINDLYYITDLLITDYSSNYFEYALMDRPVIFYTYDREFYELTRGVHKSVKDSAPGKVCDNFEELMDCLNNRDFEEEKISGFVRDNFKNYDGNATDRIIDEILLKDVRK